MRTARNIHRRDEAKVNAAMLAFVLFGLVLCCLMGLIIPSGEEVALENRLTVTPRQAIDDTSFHITADIQEDHEIQKVQIGNSQTGRDSGPRIENSEALGPDDIQLEPGSIIRGWVLVNGQGKEGVSVTAIKLKPYKKLWVYTTEIGLYEICGLTDGDYKLSVTITESGMTERTVKRIVRTSESGIFECDFLFEKGNSITGTVHAQRKPVCDVTVMASGSNTQEQVTVQNDSRQDGTYMLSGLPPGRYNLSTSFYDNGRHYNYTREVEVQQGVNVIDIHLSEFGSGEVFGFVYENNHPAPNVFVSISSESYNATITSDKNGAYFFSILSAGKIHLRALLKKRHPGELFLVEKQLELKEGETVRQDLHIATGTGVLFGNVLENGVPVVDPHVQLICYAADGSLPLRKSSQQPNTRNNGYRFEFLIAGQYELMLARPLRIKQAVYLKANEELRVDFDYSTGSGSIETIVNASQIDMDSSKIAVFLFKPDTCSLKIGDRLSYEDNYLTKFQMNDGNFFKDQLPAGSYDVVTALHKKTMILNLDIQRVTLADGENMTINVNLHTE